MTGAAAPRLALVGPVLPYRGGIAQHTTMLHRTLATRAELSTFSFTRQYPTWLYPGESDRDPAYAEQREPGVCYLLDSLNPWTWRTVAAAALRERPQAIVMPWWTVYWAPCFWYLSRAFARSGVPVLFFCHNVIEHETAPWKAALTRAVLRQGSCFAVHTRVDATNLASFLPGAPVSVHPHPVYDQFPEPDGTLAPRARLELLFYGFVRPYKGLDVLIEAMARLETRDVLLTVAGEFWEGRERVEARVRELGLADRVEIVPRYLTEAETAERFTRADVVVLPYRSGTGSGVVPLAYRYEKPVIATRVGGLPDVVLDGETGLLVPPEDAGALARAINSLSRDRARAMAPAIRRQKQAMTWDGLASTLLRLLGTFPLREPMTSQWTGAIRPTRAARPSDGPHRFATRPS